MKHNVAFHFGPIQLDPDEHLVSASRSFDLAVLDLTDLLTSSKELTAGNFAHPLVWPPGLVTREDVICLAGYPGIWREQRGHDYLRFYSFSSGAGEVLSVGEHHVTTSIQIGDCVTQIRNGKVIGSLGGLSGGPVFA